MLVDGEGDLVVIDFELATIGDPREDLGISRHMRKQPPDLIDENPDDFLSRYREITGFSEEQVILLR